MIAFGRVVNTFLVAAVLFVGPAGCREKPPAPTHNYNLSLNDTPLLPTGAPTKDASLADPQQNRADWVAFRDPADVAAEPTITRKPEADVEELTAEVKAELQEVVSDYNEVAKDGDVPGLLEYYVEQQQKVAEDYLTTAKSVGEAVANIRGALPEDAPDSVAPAIAILDRFALASSLALSIDEIEDADEQRIVGRVTSHEGVKAAMNDLEFVLVEDEWFLQLGPLEMVEGWTADAKQATEALTPLVEVAKGGGDGAELLAKLTEAGKGLLVAAEAASADDEEDSPPEGDDQDDSDSGGEE